MTLSEIEIFKSRAVQSHSISPSCLHPSHQAATGPSAWSGPWSGSAWSAPAWSGPWSAPAWSGPALQSLCAELKTTSSEKRTRPMCWLRWESSRRYKINNNRLSKQPLLCQWWKLTIHQMLTTDADKHRHQILHGKHYLWFNPLHMIKLEPKNLAKGFLICNVQYLL